MFLRAQPSEEEKLETGQPAGAARGRPQEYRAPDTGSGGAVWPRQLRGELSLTLPPGKPQVNTHSGMGRSPGRPGRPSPPGSMSESVRCVREKLAMLAGEMEKRE